MTITGPPGVGKTRLAQALDAHLWVSCAALVAASADDVAACVAAALELTPERDRVAVVGRALAARGAVTVVLDGFDGACDGGGAAALIAWTAAAPAARFRVTSRRRLGVAGERVVPLGPLGLEEARALFDDRARLAGAAAIERDAATELVKRLDGLPLAIEIAAARVRTFSPREFLAALERTPDLQGRAPGDARSLWRALDASWASATARARVLLAAASVFRGGFDRAAANAITSDEGDTADALHELSDASLIETDATGATARFRVLEPIRAWASAKLDDAARKRATLAHAEHFASRDGALLDADRENVFAAIDGALAHELPIVVRLLDLGFPLAFSRGPFARFVEQLGRALDVVGRVGTFEARAHVLLMRAQLRFVLGHTLDALGDVSEATRIADVIDSADLRAEAARATTLLLTFERRYDEALALLAAASPGEPGDARNPDQVLRATGLLHYGRGDVDRARELFQAALTRAEAARDERHAGLLHALVGLMDHERAEHDAAAGSFWRALQVLGEVGDDYVAAIARNWRSQLVLETAPLSEARAALDAVVAELERLHDQSFLRAARGYRGVAHHLAGDLAAAEADLDASIRASRASRDHYRLNHFLPHLAWVLARRGDARGAAEHLAVARDGAATAENPNHAAVVAIVAAAIDRREVDGTARARAARSADVRLALRVAAAMTDRVLAVDRTGAWFDGPTGDRVVLIRRRPLQRIVAHLASAHLRRPEVGSSSEELTKAAWGSESMTRESALHRVHVAIATLRKLGLPIESGSAGYRIPSGARVVGG